MEYPESPAESNYVGRRVTRLPGSLSGDPMKPKFHSVTLILSALRLKLRIVFKLLLMDIQVLYTYQLSMWIISPVHKKHLCTDIFT